MRQLITSIDFYDSVTQFRLQSVGYDSPDILYEESLIIN